MATGPIALWLSGRGRVGQVSDLAFTVAIAGAALTSLFIHEVRQLGSWSWEHLLALLTLGVLGFALRQRDRGDEPTYRRALSALFAWSVLLALGLAFMPGRLLHTAFLSD